MINIINEEVNYIYIKNKQFLDKIIEDQTKNQIYKLNKFFEMSNEMTKQLMLLIGSQFEAEIKRKIEHKVIIERLYSENIKEEALNRLPQYIRNLR